eukprot:3651079-Rhodomonas_salina.2
MKATQNARNEGPRRFFREWGGGAVQQGKRNLGHCGMVHGAKMRYTITQWQSAMLRSTRQSA